MANQKIMFILFAGKGGSKNDWNAVDCKNHCLLEELKKFGEIFTFTPTYNNIWWYADDIWKDKNSEYFGRRDEIFEPNLDFTLNYFDIEVFCKNIYEQVKNFDGKFVLIGHSMGAVYVYKFSEMYKDRCLFAMLFDGSTVGKYALSSHIGKVTLKDWLDEYKYFDDITEHELQELISNVKQNMKESIQKIDKLTYYKIQMQQIHDDIVHLSIPFISLKNIGDHDIDEQNKYDEGKMLSDNNDTYERIYLHNKTHFLFKNPEVIEMIINKIKEYAERYNQNGGNKYYHKYIKYKQKYLSLKSIQ